MIRQLLFQRFIPFGLGFFTAIAAIGMFGSTDVAELEKNVPGVQYSSGSSHCRGRQKVRMQSERTRTSPYTSRPEASH
jgi:hypothetical protein